MSDKRWTNDRLKELDALEELLKECESIDRGNCVLSRLARIIKLAGKLRNTDRERRMVSFFYFLQDEATRDWKAKSSPGANP